VTLKFASIAMAVLALITGIVAARYWYRSSKVDIEPIWPTGAGGPVEPGEHEDSQDGWIGGALTAFSESARLNAKAAVWTAASVVFAAIASILSAL
jgi:hypothetical protein